MVLTLLVNIVYFPINSLASINLSNSLEEGTIISEDEEQEIPLYEKPDENSDILTYLHSGDKVNVLETGEYYALIEFEEINLQQENDKDNGKSTEILQGYVDNKFLNIQQLDDDLKDSEKNVTDTSDGNSEENPDENIESDTESEEKTVEDKELDKPQTNNSNIDKETDAKEKVTVLRSGNANLIGVAKKSPTNIRTETSTKSKVLKKLPIGSVIEYKAYSEDWYEIAVEINGKTEVGFIHRKHRSEERRVGKECRSRGGTEADKKKQE